MVVAYNPLYHHDFTSTNTLNPSRVEKIYRRVLDEIAKNPLDFKKTIYAVLTAITSENGLGYHRAICWLKNDGPYYLEGVMGKGPIKLKDIKKAWESQHSLEDELRMCEEVISSDPLNRLIRDSKIYVPQYLKYKPGDHDIHYIDRGYFKELFEDMEMDTNGNRGVIHLTPDDLSGVVTVENFPPFRPEVCHEELRLVASFTNLIQVAYQTNRYIREGLAHNIRNISAGTGGLANRNLKHLQEIGYLVDRPIDYATKRIIKSLIKKGMQADEIILELTRREESYLNAIPGVVKPKDKQLSFNFTYKRGIPQEKKVEFHNPKQLRLF